MIPMADAAGLAMLVIDMQHDNVDHDGAIPAEGARSVIPTIADLLTHARASGVPIIYTQHLHRPGPGLPPDFGIAHYFEPPSCVAGSHGASLIAELAPNDSDFIVTKRRYDAFFNTDLDLLLRAHSINGLVVCGVLTDGCVLATVSHARSLDYRVWLIDDGLAGTTNTKHSAAIDLMSTYMADVRNSSSAVADIESWRAVHSAS